MWYDGDSKIADIFDCIKPPIKESFPVKCPVCGKKEGHLYFHRYEKNGIRGGRWTWCSACKCSEHASGWAPQWWDNLETISFERLASMPDYLEENKDCIDEWVNKLLFLNFNKI